MNGKENIFAISKEIVEFLDANPEKAAFLAEQPDDGRFTASYRAFSSRPDLGREGHADCYANRNIMLGFAGNLPRGLGMELAVGVSDQPEIEKYGHERENILYTIRK
jgi:hypothetical protein